MDIDHHSNSAQLSGKEVHGLNQENVTTKLKTKDSVFVNLFLDKENILQLYKELHPENSQVTVEDITVQTLKSILINTIYNDLGFIVNENGEAKFIMLVEAQSEWNPNMTLRMLWYIAETLRHYVKGSEQSVHTRTRVKLPKIELYVIYTGTKDVPDMISFKDDYFDGDCPVDVKVNILHRIGNTIYGQYIGFCRVYNEQKKVYKDSKQCIEETIRICMEKGFLTEFLNEHKEEVETMLSELFDEETQRAEFNTAQARMERAEGRVEGKAEGIVEGMVKGKTEGMLSTLLGLVKDGILSLADAAKRAHMTEDEFRAKTADI